MNRFDTEFGNDGTEAGLWEFGGLQPHTGLSRFQDRTFEIVVWAHTKEEAMTYCKLLGLKYDGQIIETIPE